MQVVRYHSLVIDPASLPEDLVPTAWTMLADAPGVDCSNGSSSDLPEGEYWMAGRPTVDVRRSQEIVLMGMSHKYRPHHGVQVPFYLTFGRFLVLRMYSTVDILQCSSRLVPLIAPRCVQGSTYVPYLCS